DGLELGGGQTTIHGLEFIHFPWDAISIFSDGNVITGNIIGTDAAGDTGLGNQLMGVRITSGNFNTVGGRAKGAGNVISGNGQDGIFLESPSTRNVIQGNRIGTNAAGTVAVPNTLNGIDIQGAVNNLVGGTAGGAGNLISGNGSDGVSITSLTGLIATGNVVAGNRIGTDVTGTLPLGNTLAGVYINFSAANNLVGGMGKGAGN